MGSSVNYILYVIDGVDVIFAVTYLQEALSNLEETILKI